MIEIAIGIMAVLYWYVTGEVWPAVLGVILALPVWDRFWFASIMLSAVILGFCIYHFWVELVPLLGQEQLLVNMAVTFIYMVTVFIRAALSFR